VMTFRACSSPTPTPVKPQPAPAILSQESVHTTLSITQHTTERPSTGPRTTHGPHQLQNDVNALNTAFGDFRDRFYHYYPAPAPPTQFCPPPPFYPPMPPP
jgi:hypothetical protein